MFHYVDDLDRFVHQNQVYKLDESNWRHLDYHFRLHIVYKMDDAKQEMSKSMLKKKIVLFFSFNLIRIFYHCTKNKTKSSKEVHK